MSVTSQRTYTVPECIGFTVNQYLFDVGISKTELATLLGVAQPNISRRIHGKSDWSTQDLLLTAELLGVEVADLLPTRGEDGNWAPAPFKPGYAKTPAGAGASSSRLRESNSRPIHYE